jgi:fibronectin type 3 domain-containing protein
MSKRSGILVALFCWTALVSGCGENPAATDTVAPAAVLDVVAQVTANVVDVSWTASSEVDLAGYHVYRATNTPDMELVGVTSTNSFHDATVASGWVRYEITAVDEAGNESPRVSTATVLVGTVTTPRRDQNHD